MIVWLASYPRSGNTFLRILLKHMYGVRSSVIYDVDGVAERLGADVIGFAERPAAVEEMRASSETYFIKTHRQVDVDVQPVDPAICLVRDGRDALVSWARLLSEADADRFELELRNLMNRHDTVGTGSWGRNVLSWLEPRLPHRPVLRYEDLVLEPRSSVHSTVTCVAPKLQPLRDAPIPSFAELQRIDNRFFRRGETGGYRDDLPHDLHELFWSQPDNVTAMDLLGYTRAP